MEDPLSDILLEIEEWVAGILEIVVSPIQEFPPSKTLGVPGQTQRFIAEFTSCRTKCVNLLTSLFDKKRQIRNLSVVGSEGSPYNTPHLQRRGKSNKTNVLLNDIQEFINMLQVKIDHVDAAITSLRSIQSANIQMDSLSGGTFSQSLSLKSMDFNNLTSSTPRKRGRKKQKKGKASTDAMGMFSQLGGHPSKRKVITELPVMHKVLPVTENTDSSVDPGVEKESGPSDYDRDKREDETLFSEEIL